MKKIDTRTMEKDTSQRQDYVAPKLTVLDAGKTASGGIVTGTESPFSATS